MPHYICRTCGVQHAATDQPPDYCLICEDERQYVGYAGQQWITPAELAATHNNHLTLLQDGLTAIKTEPSFAIGQRAHLIQTAAGNILWESISLIDDATIQAVRALGGIRAIAISHPHFYSAMVDWSYAFGNVPIYLHRSNQPFVMRPDPVVRYWDGEMFSINPDITLIRCGGHFEGSTVLHWRHDQGVLLTGDTIMVVQDRRYVSFMYSYPNLIPLSPAKVQTIVDAVSSFKFSRLYSSWQDKVILTDAKEAVQRSAKRYIEHLAD
jgi:glyoxylase-like metal-dependent hydrolase (beta-lactamase superfamily II)